MVSRQKLGLPLAVIVSVFICTLFYGCSQGNEGWGVLLWAPEESAYETGDMVLVSSVSKLNNTYDIRADKRSPAETVDQWRVSYFKRKSHAEDYRDEFGAYAELYAIATLDGLPVREERDPDAKRIYKLRDGEITKVISKDAEKSVAGEFDGYWYRILTSGGVSGYSFDLYLDIFTAEELNELDVPQESDEFLDYFLSATFRPKHYRYMLVNNRIDLSRFLPDYGVFPEPESGILHIVTEDHASTIEYSGITKVNDDTYAFDGSTLLMIVKNSYEMNLQYSDDGIQYSEEFVRIDSDIDLLIIEETERREAIFENLREMGNVLSSSAYGTITLVEGGNFTWEGFERLVPDVIGYGSGDSGRVDFKLHLGSELAKSYDGVITFIFNSSETIHFLYSTENQGIRFRYFNYEPGEEPLLVEAEGNSPIVIFFRVSTTDTE